MQDRDLRSTVDAPLEEGRKPMSTTKQMNITAQEVPDGLDPVVTRTDIAPIVADPISSLYVFVGAF
jgi:hypothetical protein